MRPVEALILRVHVPGAEPYETGDEIWQHSLAEAQTIAEDADAELLEEGRESSRDQLRDQVIGDMTRALSAPATPTAPPGRRPLFAPLAPPPREPTNPRIGGSL